MLICFKMAIYALQKVPVSKHKFLKVQCKQINSDFCWKTKCLTTRAS